jgi:hypothetical protein
MHEKSEKWAPETFNRWPSVPIFQKQLWVAPQRFARAVHTTASLTTSSADRGTRATSP